MRQNDAHVSHQSDLNIAVHAREAGGVCDDGPSGTDELSVDQLAEVEIKGHHQSDDEGDDEVGQGEAEQEEVLWDPEGLGNEEHQNDEGVKDDPEGVQECVECGVDPEG